MALACSISGGLTLAAATNVTARKLTSAATNATIRRVISILPLGQTAAGLVYTGARFSTDCQGGGRRVDVVARGIDLVAQVPEGHTGDGDAPRRRVEKIAT